MNFLIPVAPLLISILFSYRLSPRSQMLRITSYFVSQMFCSVLPKSKVVKCFIYFNLTHRLKQTEANRMNTHTRTAKKLTQKWTTNKLLTCVLLFAFVFCYFWHFVHFIIVRIIVFGAFLCEYFVSFIVASLSGPSQFIYMYGVQCTCFLSNWNDNVFVAFVHFISSLF